MYKIVFLAFLSGLFIQTETTMMWDRNYRIDWNDFKAKPQHQTEVIAVTASGLSFQYTTKRYETGRIDYDFEVMAHFYPNKSWYVREHVTEVTLSHERLHFDITELHARKFRQRVKLTRFTNNIDAEMDAIHREIIAQLREMQQIYDKETDHSRIVAKQWVWQDYVKKELEKLKRYAE